MITQKKIQHQLSEIANTWFHIRKVIIYILFIEVYRQLRQTKKYQHSKYDVTYSCYN